MNHTAYSFPLFLTFHQNMVAHEKTCHLFLLFMENIFYEIFYCFFVIRETRYV